MKNGNGGEKKPKQKTTIMIRGIEYKSACFSCQKPVTEYVNYYIADGELKHAFGVLICCRKCVEQLQAGTLKMHAPQTFPVITRKPS